MHAYYDKPVHRHSHPSPATTTKKVPVELKNKRKRREKWRPAATLLPLLTYILTDGNLVVRCRVLKETSDKTQNNNKKINAHHLPLRSTCCLCSPLRSHVWSAFDVPVSLALPTVLQPNSESETKAGDPSVRPTFTPYHEGVP